MKLYENGVWLFVIIVLLVALLDREQEDHKPQFTGPTGTATVYVLPKDRL